MEFSDFKIGDIVILDCHLHSPNDGMFFCEYSYNKFGDNNVFIKNGSILVAKKKLKSFLDYVVLIDVLSNKEIITQQLQCFNGI